MKKNTCFVVPRGGKWDGRLMAHVDFRGAPTYFAVFMMMMISSKTVNQNMLKISYFFKLFVKIRQVLEVPPPNPDPN